MEEGEERGGRVSRAEERREPAREKGCAFWTQDLSVKSLNEKTTFTVPALQNQLVRGSSIPVLA